MNIYKALKYAYRHSIRSGRVDFFSALWQGMLVHDVRIEVSDGGIHMALSLVTFTVIVAVFISFVGEMSALLAVIK